MSAAVFRFGPFELNVREHRLLRDGDVIPLRGKVFDTLRVLVENAGSLVSKEDLLRALWPDAAVEENNLNHNISILRKALGEKATGQTYIETVPRIGYRFVSPLTALSAPSHAEGPRAQIGYQRQQIRFCTAQDGARIAYATVGSGYPLVKAANWLNHLEFEWNSPIWRHWIQELSRRHLFIRYDQRGNGLSDWNVDQLSFDAMVGDLESVVDAAGPDRFVLLGTSQGGAVAAAYAARHPNRVSHLVLYGAYARGWQMRGNTQDEEGRRALMALTRLGWGMENAAFRQVWTSMYCPDATAEQWGWWNEMQRVSTSPENAARLFEQWGTIDITEALPQVRVPTIVFHCERDRAVPFEEGRRIASAIPSARFVPLPSRNHLLFADEPAWELLIGQVGEFLGWAAGSHQKTGLSAAPDDTVLRMREPGPRHIVGRMKEMAALCSAFDQVAAGGKGLMVCLSGEAGLGKTTLVEAFLADIETRGFACNIGRGTCSERLAGSEAYLPFLEALESLCQSRSGETIARMMKMTAPAWYVQIGPLTDADSATERAKADAKTASPERMKRELAAFLQQLSRVAPLVIYFDDLHWADNSTADLLSYLGTKISSMSLLLIGTYRGAEILASNHPLRSVKLEMQSHGVCRDVALEFLTEDDVGAYLALEFPDNRFPHSLAAMIHSRTEGNALFMADLVRYLQAGGVIAEKQGSWTLVQSLPDIQRDLPESVRSMIQRKMDRLKDADRRLLLVASVQGQQFDSAVVSKVLDLDAVEVEERLAALDRAAFIRLLREHEFPDSTLTSRYAFVHSLYQNALYEAVTPTRRISWSAAVAETLLEHYGERSEHIAAELALLYEAARDFGRAAEYLIAAARNAFAVAANHEASDLARRAISNADKLQDESRHKHRYQAATVLARIYDTQTRMNEAAGAYRTAAESAIEMNDPAAQVQAMCGAAMALFYGKRMEECRQEYEGAYQIAREHNLGDLLAAADAVRGAERLCAGDFDAAHQSYESAMAVLRGRSLNAGSIAALNFRGGLHAWRLEHGRAKEILDWTMQSARELGVRGRVLQNLFFQSILLGHQGRIGEALQHMQEARRVAELNGERFVLARLPNTVGWLHHEICDLECALEFDLEGVRLSQQVNDNEAEISSRINAGHVQLLMGELEPAFEHLRSAAAILDRFTWFTWLFRTRLETEFAAYWIARGDLRKANEHVAKSLALSTRSGLRKYRAWGLSLRAGIAALDDRISDARADYDAALSVLTDHPAPPTEWQIRKAYGEFLRRVGEPEAGDDQIRRALSLVNGIADSVSDERLRTVLLRSRAVREL